MKRLLLVLAVVVAVAAAYLLGRKGLPTGSGAGGEHPGETAVPTAAAAEARLRSRLGPAWPAAPEGRSGGPGAGATLELTPAELRDLAVVVLSQHDNGRRLLASSKGLETAIGESTIEVGVVVNLSEIPEKELDQRQREVVRNARRMLPFLADRDLYFGLEGRPLARQGRLAFAPDATVKLALFEFELATFADRFDADGAYVDGVDVALPFAVRSAEVRDGRLWLAVSAAAPHPGAP